MNVKVRYHVWYMSTEVDCMLKCHTCQTDVECMLYDVFTNSIWCMFKCIIMCYTCQLKCIACYTCQTDVDCMLSDVKSDSVWCMFKCIVMCYTCQLKLIICSSLISSVILVKQMLKQIPFDVERMLSCKYIVICYTC